MKTVPHLGMSQGAAISFTIALFVYALSFFWVTVIISGEQAALRNLTAGLCYDVRTIYRVQAADLTRRANIERRVRLPRIEGDASRQRADSMLKAAKVYSEGEPVVCPTNAPPVARKSIPPVKVGN